MLSEETEEGADEGRSWEMFAERGEKRGSYVAHILRARMRHPKVVEKVMRWTEVCRDMNFVLSQYLFLVM